LVRQGNLLLMEATLEALGNAADQEPAWPAASWSLLRNQGGLQWCIPREYTGQGLEGFALLANYESLASQCLTTAFILSQRDGACRRIRDLGSELLRQELLPGLARGELFATVGISHLTTSRQHLTPALQARRDGKHWILDGFMPWVTGAEKADFLVTGATLSDAGQILLVLPRRTQGVSVGKPLELMALAGSLTAQVYCEKVAVEDRWLLAGPTPGIMGSAKGGTGGLETSTLALGLVLAATKYLEAEASQRPELGPVATRMEQARGALLKKLRKMADSGKTQAAPLLRGRANALVLRATQAALIASKGSGFLRDHPAQRWARQALFFLVWSCPRPTVEATLAYLSPGSDCSEDFGDLPAG
jgi:alkylation response protein AidB-like acyl-CoA dehydrogenase